MKNTYTYSKLYMVDNGLSLMEKVKADSVLNEYRVKLLNEEDGMFSEKIINLAKELINKDSEDLELRKDVKEFLETPEFDQEMTEIQDNLGLNPEDTVNVCIECMSFLSSMYDISICKRDKGMITFLVKYSQALKSMGYKDLIDYTLDKYSEYFIKEVA